MATTYEPIATSSPTSGSTVTFSSISSSYTDLVCIATINPAGADNFALRFNNDATAIYSLSRLIGNGSAMSSTVTTNSSYPILMDGTFGSYPAFLKIDIFNYSSASVAKTFLSTASVDQNGSGQITTSCGRWNSTAAINRLDIFASFANGSVITLYGIKAA
jgi:hypothetical protein